MVISPALVLQQVGQLLQQGDSMTAERMLAPLMAPGTATAGHPGVLHAMGLVRLRQDRTEEAAAFLVRSLAVEPRQPSAALNLGKIYAGLKRADEAIAAFRNAIKLKPDLADAHFELGNQLHDSGQLEEAQNAYRRLLRVMPGHGPGKLALAAVLIEAGQPEQAETLLTRAVEESGDTKLKSAMHFNLALAQRAQRKHEAALASFGRTQALDPARSEVDLNRLETLLDLNRTEESLALYRRILAREPMNELVHRRYNELLYRMGRDEEFLASYDRAPKTARLMLDKASLLTSAGRHEQAHQIYAELMARDPADKHAASGAAIALSALGRTQEAAALFAGLVAHHPGDQNLRFNHAAVLLRLGDPQRAAAETESGLRIEPHNQLGLATQGTAWRMMADERDEILNGYDSLIRMFDLEPPDGFADMAAFNQELCTFLAGAHPDAREPVSQSLRGGTQTPDHLFEAGHHLVDRLAARISETMARYIAELKPDERHPFLSRRARDFGYSGSWSSRLGDCGYHVNHVHPGGWISSCYYVGVPDVVKDGHQGWIKFGEPGFQVALDNPVRRAIQPAPGRLVLFPSYMWHGTIPFRSATPRTTIAFDAVPR